MRTYIKCLRSIATACLRFPPLRFCTPTHLLAMPPKAVKSLISTSIVRYDNQMPGAMIKKKGQEACRHDLMERGKKLIEEIVTDAQAKKEYNNNFDDRKERMTEAVQKKGEWLSEEDMAELLAGFDFVDESSSESSSESDNDEQPAKRQRVAEEQPEAAVPEAASVDPENDPVDSQTVVAEPAPERRDFQVDVSYIEAINKITDFNSNKRQLDYVLKKQAHWRLPRKLARFVHSMRTHLSGAELGFS